MRQMVASETPVQDKDFWRTPDEVFTMLDRKYGPFTLDAAANESNHKCHLWLGPGSGFDDALAVPWDIHRPGSFWRVFCNPPYSMTADFIRKAKHETAVGRVASVTLLVPATPDVKWFHEYVWDAYSDAPYNYVTLAYSVGRIRFLRPDGSRAGTPTHGSMFVTFNG